MNTTRRNAKNAPSEIIITIRFRYSSRIRSQATRLGRITRPSGSSTSTSAGRGDSVSGAATTSSPSGTGGASSHSGARRDFDPGPRPDLEQGALELESVPRLAGGEENPPCQLGVDDDHEEHRDGQVPPGD